MDTARRPWHPDRRWADPLILLLALLAVLASGLALRSREGAARRPAARASLQGRITEVLLAGPHQWTGAPVQEAQWARARAQLREPWDQAILAVLMAELGGPGHRQAQAADAGADWQAVFAAAYEGGPLPTPAGREAVRRGLGAGHAAALVEARLLDREGGDGAAARDRARRALTRRLVGLGALGALLAVSAAGGLATALYLWGTRRRPLRLPLPAWELSGRAAILVFLLWFLAFFAAGNLAALLLSPWPGWRWAAVPLSTVLHAGTGVCLLARAEGLTLRGLWRRVAPAPALGDLAWGAAFLGLAVLLVAAVSLAANPILRPEQSPQRDLQELLRGLSGWGPTALMLLVVAGLAPAFEELLFRGFLLPVLARRTSLAAALAGSALLFGAIHLQPAGLPTLAALGFVMGLALRQRGSLWTPVLVHGCWNGSLFLLMRAFA